MKMNENELIDFLNDFNMSMSNYQINNYVLKSQVTEYRQIKQALIELESRKNLIMQMEFDHKRGKLKKEKIEYELESIDNNFDKRSLELDLEESEKNILSIEKRIKNLKKEYDYFLNKVLSKFESKEQLETYMNDPEQERKYWIARMGKQAALDMLSSGKITVGNMDSIAMMSEEDQLQILKVAVQYSGLMGVGIGKLQQEMFPYLQQLQDSSDRILPTFEGIENNLNINLLEQLNNERKSIQSSNQSEDL